MRAALGTDELLARRNEQGRWDVVPFGQRWLAKRENIRRRLFKSSVPVPNVLRMPGTPGRWCSASAAGTYRTSSTLALDACVMRRRV